MIDARVHYRPDTAPALIAKAIEVCGSQVELAERTGFTRNGIYKLTLGPGRGGSRMPYATQVMLECIVAGASDPALPKGWVVIETNTGAMDGVYTHVDDASGVLGRMEKRYPHGKWFLFALHSDPKGSVIPDAMFWTNRLGTPRDI